MKLCFCTLVEVLVTILVIVEKNSVDFDIWNGLIPRLADSKPNFLLL